MAYRPDDTQYVKKIAKVRSRHMIPMEMLSFLTLMIAGASGAFGNGWLHYQLQMNEKALEWGIVLLPVSALGVFFAAAEWWIGANWENGKLRHSVWIRMWLSGFAFVIWTIYVLWTMATLQHVASSVVLSACMVAPFHAWSWWVNYRVHCVLHPTMKTERLTRELESHNPRW